MQPEDSLNKQIWVYSACIQLVDRCDQEIADKTSPAGFNAVQAEILDLARRQLEQLGIAIGHLNASFPFSASLPEASPIASSVVHSDSSPKITQGGPTLLKKLTEEKEQFDVLYTRAVNRAISAYKLCGRKRTVNKLTACLASLDM